jgi:hypothetical protein
MEPPVKEFRGYVPSFFGVSNGFAALRTFMILPNRSNQKGAPILKAIALSWFDLILTISLSF